jgi:hypothetical protein
MEPSDILKRIDELLALQIGVGNASLLSQGCVSLLSLVYGPKSAQIDNFNSFVAAIHKGEGNTGWKGQQASVAAQGALKNLKREIESGLTGNFKLQVTGEVLTDFIQLARTALNESGDGAKNVAAVLTAAAFEDTIRRMGETFAGVIGKDDLSEVLKRLKDAGVIQSPQVGIAQAYLSFRNHALHANWDKVERESIQSVLGFVEQLLLKHFAPR